MINHSDGPPPLGLPPPGSMLPLSLFLFFQDNKIINTITKFHYYRGLNINFI